MFNERICMKKLLLACTIVASTGSLHGMEIYPPWPIYVLRPIYIPYSIVNNNVIVPHSNTMPLQRSKRNRKQGENRNEMKKNIQQTALPQMHYHISHDFLPQKIVQFLSPQLTINGIDPVQSPELIEQSYAKLITSVSYLKQLCESCSNNVALKKFKVMLCQQQVSICDIKDIHSRTILHIAGIDNNPILAQMIIKVAGNNVWTLLSTKDSWSGSTPLHLAAEYGCIETVKLLLDAAGDRAIELLKYQNLLGEIPLDSAIENKNNSEKIVALIMDFAAGKI